MATHQNQKKYLKTLNTRLIYINKNLPLIIKEVSLSILTTALEIKKIKEKYRRLKNNISNVQKKY